MCDIVNDIKKYNIFKISRSKGVTQKALYDALNSYDDIEKVLYILTTKCKNLSIPEDDTLKKELEEIEKIKANIIFFTDDIYPALLKSIDNFPLCLTCAGNIDILKNERRVAIIGSRACSINNFNFCKRIAKEVSSYGYIVVSGLAKGIDSSAHIGSLENGTIAVLGSGLHNLYPKENEYLYHDIIKNNGLVITEYSLNTLPKPEHFPMRNRIIAGLSRGLIVMGAGKISGTMHTINQANKYNREVMIFPGSPYDERFVGSNKLLQEGATMVIDTKDIIENLESFIPDSCFNDRNIIYNYDEEEIIIDLLNEKEETIEEKILSRLDFVPVNINELINSLPDYDLNLINSSIIKLQMENKIIIDFGNVTLKI